MKRYAELKVQVRYSSPRHLVEINRQLDARPVYRPVSVGEDAGWLTKLQRRSAFCGKRKNLFSISEIDSLPFARIYTELSLPNSVST
jgi:hypothetical protein